MYCLSVVTAPPVGACLPGGFDFPHTALNLDDGMKLATLCDEEHEVTRVGEL